MQPENALVSRKLVWQRDDKVVLVETWDTAHPDCPFVVIGGGEIKHNPHIIALHMTEAEYQERKPPLKD